MAFEIINIETCKHCQSCNPVKLKRQFFQHIEISILLMNVYEGAEWYLE